MPNRGRRFAAKTGIDEGLLPGSAIASAIGQADWMEAALSVEVRCVLSLNRLFTFELFRSTIAPETDSVSGFVRQARPPDRNVTIRSRTPGLWKSDKRYSSVRHVAIGAN